MRLLVSSACAIAMACGGTPPPPPQPPPPSKPAPVASDDKSGFAQKDFAPYRSDRFGLTVPLPDRATWSIVDRDDKNGGWLVATHPPTGTVLRARRFDETTLVGRLECEMRAQLAGVLPRQKELDSGKYQTMFDKAVHRPAGWDGRQWEAFESRPGGGLAGHVVLASGKGHWCLVVHVLTEVVGDSDAEALADRLEMFALRTVGAVSVDSAKEPSLPSPP